MKVNVADVITVRSAEGAYELRVEDASKGDVISGKIVKVIEGSYQVGQVHEFSRDAIEE